jgi:hypothetical protein
VLKYFARGAAGVLAVGLTMVWQPASADAATSALYSDPVYWPLHVQSYVDCTDKVLPGCPTPHTFWGVDVIPTGQAPNTAGSTAGVYSMGAGIAHIGNAHGSACGTGTATDFGTWVWVDHGGGVVSRYGHLGSIAIKEGQHVASGALLGTVGNTGNAALKDCWLNYVDFQVLHNGYHGPSVEFSTTGLGAPDGELLGCSGSTTQYWPTALADGFTRINDMWEKTLVPASSSSCLPGFLAASVTNSPTEKVSAGNGSVSVSWGSGPSGTNAVRIEVGMYHPTTGAYDSQWNETWRDVSSSTRSASFGGLKHKIKYRVRIWYHTAAGWRANTGFASVTTK